MKIDFERDTEHDTKDTDAYKSTPIKFCFVGPRGVGKTSLLASMYEQIKKSRVSSVNVDIHTESGAMTQRLLDDAHQKMLEMLGDTEEGGIVEVSLGVDPTPEDKVFEFIGVHDLIDRDLLIQLSNKFFGTKERKQFRFVFQFTDMPGLWYDPNRSEKQKAKDTLNDSLVSFLAVDAPALMEGGAVCRSVNRSSVISAWYGDAAPKLGDAKHTVVIVLSRCEKFWDEKEIMLNQLQNEYGSMIASLKQNGVQVYVTWVKTLGGLKFVHHDKKRLENGTKEYLARFVRVGDYCPENCAMPLQLALSHGLKRVAEAIEPNVWTKLGFNIRELSSMAASSLANDLLKVEGAGSEEKFKQL